MLAFRFHQTLFTHIIAAPSSDEATRVARQYANSSGEHGTVEQWYAPDTWTKRAVNSATEPGIIDVAPRFVIDTVDGPRRLNIDALPWDDTSIDWVKMRRDSDTHDVWLDACYVESVRNRDGVLKNFIGKVATERDPKRYVLLTRALAGAWGLGPIPEWHAAVLPALIALDIETTDCVNTFRDDVFELDRAELIAELRRCAAITEHVPGWCVASMRMLASGLSSDADTLDLRVRCNSVLALCGWLR